jgi:mono/diheme cytochrome c family protein
MITFLNKEDIMRLAFIAGILFAGYFIVFGMFPLDTEANFRAPAGLVSVDGASAEPAAPQINKNSAGGKLFVQNCARCHSTSLTKELTGPALWGVGERVEDRELLAAWIKNSTKVLESGDPYFTKLYEKWNKAGMDPMPHLSDEDIDAIITELTDPT